MFELVKDNWFVVLIAIIIIGFISYFVYDSNKYNVSSATDDGKDVVASVSSGSVTADDLYEDLSEDDSALLYNMYRNAVVDQSVETTDEIQEDADTLQSNIESTAKQQTDNYETYLASELAQYGFNGYDELDDYCLMSVKQKKLNEKYVNKHFDELKSSVKDKKPRTISIIMISVADADNLTDDEQTKKDNIDSALSKQSFAKTATAYSEDTTASEKGFYGYIDEDDADSSSSLDSSVIEAAMDLKKGETSDWITVTDEDSGYTYLYRVYVNQTNIDKIHNSKSSTVRDQLLNAILNNNDGLEETIVQTYAKKLDIKFNDKSVKKKINAYIKEQQEGADE